MREFRIERARRAGIREERLRATAGFRQALPMTSWRGRSGRRYVVGIHALAASEVVEVTEAVLIAVSRGVDGTARVVDIATAGPFARDGQAHWMTRARDHGATEMHVHRLALTEDERRAVAEDLRERIAG
jgi:hypothetical protein